MDRILLLALCGCGGDAADPSSSDGATTTSEDSAPFETSPPLGIVAEPVLSYPEPSVRLARRLTLETAEPTALVLELDDGELVRRIAFPGEATAHDVPVLGLLEDTHHELTVTVTAARGATASFVLPIDSEPLDLPHPDLTLLAHDPSRAEGGYTLIPGRSALGSTTLLVDEQGRPRWARAAGAKTFAVELHDDGRATGLIGSLVTTFDLLGVVTSVYGPPTNAEVTVPVDIPDFHHEAQVLDDGTFFTLTAVSTEVDAFPLGIDDLFTFGPATIKSDHVLEIAPDGAVVHDWAIDQILDPRRVSAGSFDEVLDGYDWSHANAVVYQPEDDSLLVSLRHQDAVIEIDRQTGELHWILANHDGWPPELQPYLLEPVGTVTWPYHQHAPERDGDRLLLFDNGNDARTTPYSRDPSSSWSRLVEYEIDEAAGTVSQTWEYVPESDLFSVALGNADRMPRTGNVLGTFSHVYSEDGVKNTEQGLSQRSARLIEVDAETGEPVWDLRLTSLLEVDEDGWDVDRATRVASLYPSDVVVEVLPAR